MLSRIARSSLSATRARVAPALGAAAASSVRPAAAVHVCTPACACSSRRQLHSSASVRAAAPSKYSDFKQNVLFLGDTAPDFKANTSTGPISFHEWIGEGKWCVLFSHPRDFTPVCTTELGRVAKLSSKFAERNTKVIALSVDEVDRHGTWINDINEINGTKVDFPIIADPKREISCLYGMLNQEHFEDNGMPFTVRSVFIIGPDRKIKTTISYPASTGRNFNEILRVLDSLQLAVSHKVATPADWTPGADVVVLPTIPTDEARKLFPKGVNEIRPWLRTTPDPKN